LIRGFDRIIQSSDTANKPNELADYSVCTTWGLMRPNFYLLDVLCGKLSYPELKRAVIDQDGRFTQQTQRHAGVAATSTTSRLV
jgi:phage terminase large subunit-like protein